MRLYGNLYHQFSTYHQKQGKFIANFGIILLQYLSQKREAIIKKEQLLEILDSIKVLIQI